MILSSGLARTLGARLGDTVDVYTPLMLEKLKRNDVMLPRALTVVGIFEIGHQQLDSSLVITTLRTLQHL